ncbi:hypothetical protein SAMN04487904_10313 [Actinopolyspora lacussalsi subsp. righensis]|uniref:Uncharacterized protein n=1 Tax=Actinopolyspora righensis TaxID=995060 RepID=A0A1I6YN64_9ACTN|nr:hypothetical protein SAMN04487904_10313 [Actinopolyspora righensis]
MVAADGVGPVRQGADSRPGRSTTSRPGGWFSNQSKLCSEVGNSPLRTSEANSLAARASSFPISA